MENFIEVQTKQIECFIGSIKQLNTKYYVMASYNKMMET